ncbi:MAG: DUF554 domain-containing protein [Anaerosomatales bacterium]|nr:DUF554 domain-containing protein [Anaerosomatales bacterium]MDT8434146.1 DUF554 domain-containing protein [Anaerosomatales bacterium]
MPGLGVIVNVVAVLAGTAVGLLFGRLIAERFRLIAFAGIGLATMVIGASMSLGGLADLSASELGAYASLVLVGSLVLGSLAGEGLRIEYWLERFGQTLQKLAYRAPVLAPGRADQPGEKGHTLVEGFVTASLLFCVGAMTILGSIQDGLGDPSLLYLKALLDGIASIALATTLGAGVGLSVIPIIIIQGGIAAGAHSVEAFMTPEVINSIQAVGGALIFAIGLDLAGIKRLPVGNMLPAILVGAVLVGVLT